MIFIVTPFFLVWVHGNPLSYMPSGKQGEMFPCSVHWSSTKSIWFRDIQIGSVICCVWMNKFWGKFPNQVTFSEGNKWDLDLTGITQLRCPRYITSLSGIVFLTDLGVSEGNGNLSWSVSQIYRCSYCSRWWETQTVHTKTQYTWEIFH